MTETERRQYIDYMVLKEELVEEKSKGYALSLGGREACPDEIARACIFREETSYMRDYDTGFSGRSKEIAFAPIQ